MTPLPTDLERTLVVVLGCVVVPAALLLGAASAVLAAHTKRAVVSFMAGFLLLVLVGADLVPDAVGENAATGGSLLWVLLPAALTFVVAGVVLWRPAASDCCSQATGLLTALALVGHGLLEGFVVGLGTGVGLAVGLGLIALLAGHRFAEGFALETSLRTTPRRTRRTLVALAAVTPLVGGGVGLLVSPGPRGAVVITAALAGLLAAAGLRLLAGSSLVGIATDVAAEPANPPQLTTSTPHQGDR